MKFIKEKDLSWISVNDNLPAHCQDIYIKTDCEECPICSGIYWEGKFVVPVTMQCDKHLEADQKNFTFIRKQSHDEHNQYTDRITHWMPRPERTRSEGCPNLETMI